MAGTLVGLVLVILYVGAIYIASYVACPVRWHERDLNRIIKARCAAVILFSLAILLYWPLRTWSVEGRPVMKSLLMLSPLIVIQALVEYEGMAPLLRQRLGLRGLMIQQGLALAKEPFLAFVSGDWAYIRDIFVVQKS